MKKLILFTMSLAMILTGCTTVNNTSKDNSDNEKLVLRCPIDGADQIHIRHDKLWYIHLENCYPGQWSGLNEPTYINDDPWYPQWPYYTMVSDKYTITDPAFILPKDTEFTKDTLKVDFGRSKDNKVLQYPNATNEYTLVLYMNERGYIGQVWQTVKIEWDKDQAKTPTEAPAE